MSAHIGRTGTRLSSADIECVFPGGDDRISDFGDHAKIAVLQLEVDGTTLADIEMNPLKSAESYDGGTFYIGEVEV